jgi:hypothetical protein
MAEDSVVKEQDKTLVLPEATAPSPDHGNPVVWDDDVVWANNDEDNIGIDSPENVLAKLAEVKEAPEPEVRERGGESSLAEELKELRKEISSLDDNVGSIDDKVAEVQAKVEAAEGVLDVIQDQTSNISEDVEALKQTLLSQGEQMKKIIKHLSALLKMVTFLHQNAAVPPGEPSGGVRLSLTPLVPPTEPSDDARARARRPANLVSSLEPPFGLQPADARVAENGAVFGAKQALHKALPTGEATKDAAAANGAPEGESPAKSVSIGAGAFASFKRTRDSIQQ